MCPHASMQSIIGKKDACASTTSTALHAAREDLRVLLLVVGDDARLAAGVPGVRAGELQRVLGELRVARRRGDAEVLVALVVHGLVEAAVRLVAVLAVALTGEGASAADVVGLDHPGGGSAGALTIGVGVDGVGVGAGGACGHRVRG